MTIDKARDWNLIGEAVETAQAFIEREANSEKQDARAVELAIRALEPFLELPGDTAGHLIDLIEAAHDLHIIGCVPATPIERLAFLGLAHRFVHRLADEASR